MIRLRTLGSIGLTAASGTDLAAVLRQPKRLALLTYLALARPRGFHRRDSLLALFWPEMDTEHARASLRQALYTLRRELPEGALAKRGDGEVRLSAGAVSCDVDAFEAHLAAGRAEAALELYGGEFLPGFHVADAAPELDYWIDAERSRLHDLAISAALNAAASAAGSDHDPEAVIRLAGRASTLAPLDEEVARTAMTLRHQVGDRAGALLAFEQWKHRAEEELGLEPSPATLELIERIRTAVPGRLSRSTTASRTGRAAPVAPSVPLVVESAAPVAPVTPVKPRRRIRRLAAGAAAVVAIIALILLLPIRVQWSDGDASPAGSRLMVLPFSYRGGGEADYLSEGLVYLFSVAMDGEELRTLDPNGLIRRAAGGDGDRTREYEPAVAAALAAELGAAYYLLGSVVETSGGLQLSASLYDRASPAPVARATATGTPADVLDLVDEISAQLLTSRAGAAVSRAGRLAAVTSHSLPALKSYLTGERLLRQGRFDGAIEAFESAVVADSLFALAHYRTSQAASWAFRGPLATQAASRAVHLAERLPERERRLLLAHETYRRGDAPEALAALRELSLLYPDDPEVWYRLAEVRMHYGPLHGWSIAGARDPFLRAVELDSSYTGALTHLAQLAALAADTTGALEFTARALAAAPDGSRAPQLRVLRTLFAGGSGWKARLAELDTADDFTVISSVYNASVYARRPDLGREIARILVRPSRPQHTRAFGYVLLAQLELALGRWGATEANLEDAERLDREQADRYRAMLAAAPAARATSDELARLMERLAVEDDPEPTAGGLVLEPETRYHPLPRLYSLGIAAALMGDAARLDYALSELRTRAAPGPGDHAVDLQVMRGLAGEAPDAVSPPRYAVIAEEAVLSPVLSRPGRRFAEARRLEREGRSAEALLWYASLDAYSVPDLAWGIPALLDRAHIHEALGEDSTAAGLYRRFADLWRDADDPAPRERALRSLARLERRDR